MVQINWWKIVVTYTNHGYITHDKNVFHIFMFGNKKRWSVNQKWPKINELRILNDDIDHGYITDDKNVFL